MSKGLMGSGRARPLGSWLGPQTQASCCGVAFVVLSMGFILAGVNHGWSDEGEVVVEPGDPSILIHAQELLDNQRVDSALDLLLPVLQLEDMRPILTQRYRADAAIQPSTREYRLYWPMGRYVQSRFLEWASTRPEVLLRYQRRSDPSRTNWENQPQFRSLVEQVDAADRFRLNSGMRQKTLLLGVQLWETGQVLEARRMWLTLVPQAWKVVREGTAATSLVSTVEYRPLEVPGAPSDGAPSDGAASDGAEDSVSGQALAYLALASIAEKDDQRAARELELLKALAPRTRIKVLGAEVDAMSWLSDAMELLRQDKLETRSPGAALDAERFSQIRVEWQVGIRSSVGQEDLLWAKQMPTLEELLEMRSRVRPSWEGGQVLWSEGDRVRMLWADTGAPRFPAGGDWDNDPMQRGTLWEAGDSNANRPDGRSVAGSIAFTSDLHGSFAVARVGDPRSIQRAESPRQRSEWVAFDLEREGSLLAGFPLQPTADGWEFEGNPLCDGERLFVLKRYSQTDSQQSRLVLVCYALKAIQTPGDWQPLWETPLSESASLSQGQYHEISHPRLAWDGRDLLVMTNLGAVIRVDSRRGSIQWLLSYPRDIATSERDVLPLHWMRSGRGMVRVGQTLWVLPADTPELLCLDALSGELLWATEVQGCLDLVGVTEPWVILSGAGLVWVDRFTGSVGQRWPADSWPLKPHFRWPESSGGRAAMEGDWIYWSTTTDMWILEKDLVKSSIPGGQTWWKAEVTRRLSLSDLGLSGGDLRVIFPRVWIIGAETVTGLRFTSPP